MNFIAVGNWEEDEIQNTNDSFLVVWPHKMYDIIQNRGRGTHLESVSKES